MSFVAMWSWCDIGVIRLGRFPGTGGRRALPAATIPDRRPGPVAPSAPPPWSCVRFRTLGREIVRSTGPRGDRPVHLARPALQLDVGDAAAEHDAVALDPRNCVLRDVDAARLQPVHQEVVLTYPGDDAHTAPVGVDDRHAPVDVCPVLAHRRSLSCSLVPSCFRHPLCRARIMPMPAGMPRATDRWEPQAREAREKETAMTTDPNLLLLRGDLRNTQYALRLTHDASRTASRPARLRQRGHNDLLEGGLGRDLDGEDDSRRDDRRVLQVCLVRHWDALFDKAVEEVGAHPARDHRRDA